MTALSTFDRQTRFLDFAETKGFSAGLVVTRADLTAISDAIRLVDPTEKEAWWLINPPQHRALADDGVTFLRGMFVIPMTPDASATSKPRKARAAAPARKAKTPAERLPLAPVATAERLLGDAPAAPTHTSNLQLGKIHMDAAASFVPNKDSDFVKTGAFPDVLRIIKSGEFMPCFLSGLTGTGKTKMVEQACAAAKREFFRVQVNVETDEDSFLGGFRLVDGNMVWQDGPVISAMRRGGVCLLDEMDTGSSKLMCLQPVLEGGAVLINKTGELVYPMPGFTVFATANTKGKGDITGNYVGTMVMNEAMLDRFPVTIDVEYPKETIEIEILLKKLAEGDDSLDFATCLVRWANQTRVTYTDGAAADMIPMRRLLHICSVYSIFGKREKAIEMCLARYSTDTQVDFMSAYKLEDVKVQKESRARIAAAYAASPEGIAEQKAKDDQAAADKLAAATAKAKADKAAAWKAKVAAGKAAASMPPSTSMSNGNPGDTTPW